MAQKRMLSKSIIDTDLFLEMPISARLLYYDFCMRADDDGFIDAPLKILKSIGCSEDDLRILITKKYIIPFESKVCVIRHWLIHNTLRKDRYNPTIHIDERNRLMLNGKTYVLQESEDNGNRLATTWQPSIEENSSNSNNIYELIEQEFGRTLSPLEFEMINSWEYPYEIIKLAVKEASTSGQFVMKYIDRILYNWKKANVRTVEEAKKYIENFNSKKQNKSYTSKTRSTDSIESAFPSIYKELE